MMLARPGFVDPTPNDPATNVWDVVAHHGRIVDICGDDGHFRSLDAGATWTAGSGLPSGLCSIAASPHERDVVFAAVSADAWETDNGGTNWIRLGTPELTPPRPYPLRGDKFPDSARS